MKIFDLLTMCFSNLLKRKTRTLLTLLGVVLGSASVALTFAIGDAVEQNNALLLESTGLLKYIEVYSDNLYGEDSSSSSSNSNNVYLDEAFINKLKKIDGVDSIFYSLYATENIILTAGKNNKYQIIPANICGIDFNEAEKFGLKVKNNKKIDSAYKFSKSSKDIKVIGGEYFEYMFYNTAAKMNKRGGMGGGPYGGGRGNNSDSRMMNSPVYRYMFSKWGNNDMVADAMPPFVNADKDDIYIAIQYPNDSSTTQISEYDVNFDPESNLENSANQDAYKYKKYKITLVGRTDWNKVKDNNFLSVLSGNYVFVNIETLKNLLRESRKLNNDSYSSSNSNVPEFQFDSVVVQASSIDNVSDITKEIKKMGYEVYNLVSTIENEQLRARSNQFVLGFLGMLALVVSAISISNTMVTSVYERTKEIGIMKVLGCKIGNIQIMFLIESAFIGFIGGVIGMVASYSLANFMNKLITNNVENLGVIGKIISEYVEGMKSEIFSSFNSDVTMKVAVIKPQLWLYVILGTTIIGLLAGYLPSVVASKIEALRAIKTSK